MDAKEIYQKNFENVTWYGRCIFLSWYCEVGTCKFCFRSTIKHKIKHKESAKRSIPSIIVEALLCKKLNWRIEFLTGGYGIFPFEDIVEAARLVSLVYGEKIWVNLGALKKEELEKLKPYVKGIVASIETTNNELHKKICPDKDIAPYVEMYKYADVLGLKKSMTIVIGLGETEDDFESLVKFIEDNKLHRITFYALKPVLGSGFSKGPKKEYYFWWLQETRKRSPKLEIIAGTTARRYEEVFDLLESGANAFTKFPATKLFGTKQAISVKDQIINSGRKCESELVHLPDIDWNDEIGRLDIDEKLKSSVKEKMKEYLDSMEKNSGDEFE